MDPPTSHSLAGDDRPFRFHQSRPPNHQFIDVISFVFNCKASKCLSVAVIKVTTDFLEVSMHEMENGNGSDTKPMHENNNERLLVSKPYWNGQIRLILIGTLTTHFVHKCTAFVSFMTFSILQMTAAIFAGSEALVGDSAAMMVDALTYLLNWYDKNGLMHIFYKTVVIMTCSCCNTESIICSWNFFLHSFLWSPWSL